MRKLSAVLLVLLLVLCLSSSAWAAGTITTTATGYTCAEDVEYVIVGTTVVNWGARGEDCTFLSTYAEDYYTGTYRWEELSELDGGTGTSDAYSSELYESLQAMMKTCHTKIQGYQDTRQYYQYTDCTGNDHSLISSFYSGKTVASKWTGSTYNREHVWPRSKCISTDKKNDSADIMMLRATISSENSSRGNSAYGEGSGYFDPGAAVRGDCARMVLYGYVRWGNTGKMWGTSGVMESLDILLKWMEEDPVDTWEMGRNDAVESITGVRNVFVDYPEYAWLLFGREIPEDMVTPSGNAVGEEVHTHSYTSAVTTAATCTQDSILTYTCTCGDSYTEVISAIGHQYKTVVTAPTCTEKGYTTYTCADCGDSYRDGYTDALGHSFGDWIIVPGGGSKSRWCSVCDYQETEDLSDCQHPNTERFDAVAATCTEDGFTGRVFCNDCGKMIDGGETIPATGHSFGEWITAPGGSDEESRCCSVCSYEETRKKPECQHPNTYTVNDFPPTCTQEGSTGMVYCSDCQRLVTPGETIPATGHSDGDQDWFCDVCAEGLCEHGESELRDAYEASCGADGYSGDTYCVTCGQQIASGSAIAATGHGNTETRNRKDATCAEDGYTGDVYCIDCGEMVETGSLIPATGEHVFGDLIGTGISTTIVHDCTVCGYREIYCYIDYIGPTQTQPEPEPEPDRRPAIIVAIAAIAMAGSISCLIVIRKKKK